MSARRRARAGRPAADVATAAGGVPRALLIGRCLEVWAEARTLPEYTAGLPIAAAGSARRRFALAREAWLSSAGADTATANELVPNGAPWSATFVSPEHLAARLARAGCTEADLPTLRDEAEHIYAGPPRHGGPMPHE